MLLISVDTVRADSLVRKPGDAAPDMPALRRLAEESWWWTEAFAPMAFTLPSHMTLFTGLHPESHAVTIERSRLAATLPTLAETLREHDYSTHAWVTSSWLKGAFGFARGFDTYEELPVGLTFAPRLNERIVEALSAERERPTFLFAHYYDAHSDFSSSEGNELTYYSPPEYRSDLEVPREALCDASGTCATARLLAADRGEIALAPGEVELHRELYRRGVRFLDDQLAELFDRLRRIGAWERLIVVVVSDHGEEFQEHGRLLHSQVFRESLHVPVIIRRPGAPPRRSSELAGLEDVAPTLLSILDVQRPGNWTGQVLDAVDSRHARRQELVGEDKLVRSVYALRTPDELLVWDFATGEGRTFDVRADPGETVPRAGADELLRTRLFAHLRRLRSLRPGLELRSDLLFDESERAVLRSLGYL